MTLDKTVSVIIPCLNEEKHIAECLDSLLANDYDKKLLDIIVIDGLSTDRTREILKSYCDQHNFIRVLDNPKRVTPAALNVGVRASQAEVIVRVDSHNIYAPNYISTLVNGLYEYQADNIGGIRETALVHTSLTSLALSIAISHPFTAGNAHYRIGTDKVREVDTVFCGCFRRSIFEKIGYFNENITRNEDRDFNARILEAGGKIVLDPSTHCTYYARTNFWDFCKWNAYGPFRLFYNHQFTHVTLASWRNLIPALFLLWQILAVIVLLFSVKLGLLLLLPLAAYFIIAFALSLKLALVHKSPLLAPVMLVVFAMIHYGYAAGSMLGMPWYFSRRKKPTTIEPLHACET
jgi:glycosyltransferase involved in cell wall biosynthesis